MFILIKGSIVVHDNLHGGIQNFFLLFKNTILKIMNPLYEIDS